jgi:hypothetical protein
MPSEDWPVALGETASGTDALCARANEKVVCRYLTFNQARNAFGVIGMPREFLEAAVCTAICRTNCEAKPFL